MRTRENFDKGWLFYKGDLPVVRPIKAGLAAGVTNCRQLEDGKWLEVAFADKADCNDSSGLRWAEVTLPHDWCVEEPYVRDDPNDPDLWVRGYQEPGIGCYRKEFHLPENDRGKQISIEFDGIARNASVYVNGHFLGTHFSGYTSFCCNITEIARYGEEGGNVLFIRVDASQYEGWWYEGAGIYRHTWLVKTNALHVKRFGAYAETQEITQVYAKILVKTDIVNEAEETHRFRLISSIVDDEGRTIAHSEADGSLKMLESGEFIQNIKVDSPRLWSCEEPNLYSLITSIQQEGVEIDRYETNLGIRTIEFTSEQGFFLNGKHLQIKGTANHQDFAGVGIALPDKLQEYKVRLLKEMGCNAYRCAHHMSVDIPSICDRLGMLVVAENRRLDSSPEGILDLEELVRHGRSHPSIILWCVENEEVIEGTPIATRLVKRLKNVVHHLDSSRPVMAAVNHGQNSNGYGDALDILGYNYGQTDGQKDIEDHKCFPDRKIIGSECASCVHTRGIYETDSARGYLSSYARELPSWCCTPEKAWTDVVDNPFLTGVFLWTGFDYRGEPTPNRWPNVSSHFGLMDTCGFPKDWYYYCKSVWTEEPMIHIFPHWNWEGKDGKLVSVWAFSNCDSVELFLNGKSYGEQKLKKNYHLEWQVPYCPGELSGVGRIGGKVCATQRVQTAGKAIRLHMTPDTTVLKANDCDVCVVRVSILDQVGTLVPTANTVVSFFVSGPGKILGVGNGDPSCHEPDKALSRSTFNGHCMVIVQATEGEGDILLVAESDSLQQDTAKIMVCK